MIESWLPEDRWPSSVVDATQIFRQGNVLDWTGIVFGASFSNAVCVPTKDVGDSGTGYVKIEDAWKHVLITSQTCDICEEGRRKPQFPWISASPVYNILPALADRGRAKQVRSGLFGYLVPLSAEEFSRENELWVADLRVEFPLEKSVLVGQPVREAFREEEEYAKLASQLAGRRNRPVIDDFVRKAIILPLQGAFRNDESFWESIAEIRIRCGPTWSSVSTARLIVLLVDGTSIEVAESHFERWETKVRETLPAAFTLLPSKIVFYSDFRYVESLAAPLVDLSVVSSS